jgi:6-phosphogluconate dehydrogenase
MNHDIGVIGLGVMGSSLARNFASRGYSVAGYDRSYDKAQAVSAAHPEAKLDVHPDLTSFVASLSRPRHILVMVVAGSPVDDVIDALEPLLEAGDIVIDGGNSLHTDTERRAARAAARPWRFVGMGVSGGEEGALLGPSLMPGGDFEAWQRLAPALQKIAAVGSDGPCVAHCGQGAAGHFVKMVHNGIEYGDMQLIAEVATLLRRGLGLGAAEVADTFASWNEGELESFLVEITADILRVADPANPGQVLVDAVLDEAGQKGTGRWTVIAAAELGVAIPTIAAAVDARITSSDAILRGEIASAMGHAPSRLEGVSRDDLRDALYAAKIASYAQGFALLGRASEVKGYGTELAEVARIWTAGCIIRARFLDRVSAAYAKAAPASLLLDPGLGDDLRRCLPGYRRVVAAAVREGYAIPGLATTLSWIDAMSTQRGARASSKRSATTSVRTPTNASTSPVWPCTPSGRSSRGAETRTGPGRRADAACPWLGSAPKCARVVAQVLVDERSDEVVAVVVLGVAAQLERLAGVAQAASSSSGRSSRSRNLSARPWSTSSLPSKRLPESKSSTVS